MPPIYRILEVSVYSILNFFPHMILAMYPFRRRLRFSLTVTGILIAIITVIQIVIGNLAAFSTINNGILSILSTGVYALFYFFAVKAQFGKSLFTLLMLSNMANFVIISSKCLEGLIFGDIALESYRYTYSICMVIVHIITTIPLFIYIHNYVTPIMETSSLPPLWKFAWLVPATFYIIWYHHIYGSEKSSLEIALDPNHTILLLIIDMGSLLIYHMVINIIMIHHKYIELEKNNQLLTIQNLQYENLRDKINEARQANHDIRHHITIMDSYLQKGEYDKLGEYLKSYKKSLPDNSRIVFCKHYAINTLLLYFAQQAKNNNIDFDVIVADIPEKINLPDDVLSVVLGNLLENAIEACLRVKQDNRKITIRSKAADGNMFFKIDNTYNGDIKKDKNGFYLSSKHSGRGIGLRSVRNIISRYDGIIEIEQTDNVFSVSVFSEIPK